MLNFKEKKYKDLISGRPTVSFTAEDGRFSVDASLAGVTLRGELCLVSHDELQETAKVFSDAWQRYSKLKYDFAKEMGRNHAGH